MQDIKKTIGIIGFGNMGQAIALQLIKTDYLIYVFDKEGRKTEGLSGIQAAKAGADLAGRADVIILAVKPQDFDTVLRAIKNYAKEKLIISIAAGINTKYIEKILGNARVVRAMPNIGVKISESVTSLCKGMFASDTDLALAQELFNYLGATLVIEEEMMNAATAISGSGPAYVFDFLEANSIEANNIPEQTKHDIMKRLEKAAQSLGFNHEDAVFLSVNTVNASINLIRKTKTPPAELKKQVASKGGTTEEALKALHKTGSWEEAALAALKRAEGLAREV